MAFSVHCIELAAENRDKAEAIMFKYSDNGDINIKYSEYSSFKKLRTIQYWFTCKQDACSDVIANELKENGIELF